MNIIIVTAVNTAVVFDRRGIFILYVSAVLRKVNLKKELS